MTVRTAAPTTTDAAPLGPAAAAERARRLRAADGISPRLRRFTSAAGGFYLTMAGLNAGLAIARPHVYDPFADEALFTWVRESWRTVFAAHPSVWAGVLAAGEAGIGVALLSGGRWAFAGYAAVVGFHLALLLFGWGAWLWAVPVLAVVVPAGWRHVRSVRAVR